MEKKILTWQTYLKSNPNRYHRHDSTFGTKSVIEPTLIGNGFIVHVIEYDNWDKSVKPKKLVSDYLSGYDFNIAVYSTWNARDSHSAFIYIGFKSK